MQISPSPGRAAPTPSPAPPDAELYRNAQQLEAVFLAEMLACAGVEAGAQAFGGGAGEEQFASFLRQEQAMAMVRSGGTGLAESLFHAMGGRDVGG